MKKLLLPLVLSLLPLTSMAVGIQSNGTDSVAWTENGTSSASLPLTLTNHGGIFLNYTFSLGVQLRDEELPDDPENPNPPPPPYGSVYISLNDGNEFVLMTGNYLSIGDLVDENSVFETQIDSEDFSLFISGNSTFTNVTLGSNSTNYLGIKVWEQTDNGNGTFTNTNPHFGWIQLQLDSTGTGVTFITGYVNNTANETATVGTVPEPSTVALLVAAVTGMALLGRTGMRQKK